MSNLDTSLAFIIISFLLIHWCTLKMLPSANALLGYQKKAKRSEEDIANFISKQAEENPGLITIAQVLLISYLIHFVSWLALIFEGISIYLNS